MYLQNRNEPNPNRKRAQRNTRLWLIYAVIVAIVVIFASIIAL